MKIKKAVNLVSWIITAAFLFSFLLTAGQFKTALAPILSNRYMDYRMFRLVLAGLNKPLLQLTLTTLGSSVALLLISVLWLLFFSKAIGISLDIRVIDRQKLKTYLTVTLCCLFLSGGLWLVNSRSTAAGFDLTGALLNMVVLLLGILPIWFLRKGGNPPPTPSPVWRSGSAILRRLRRVAAVGIRVVAVAAAFLSAVLLFFAAKTVKPNGPNILLIVVDCLRADHLGCYGYGRATTPHIDHLASTGTLFKNAYSSAPWTKPAVASILTSLHAVAHGTVNNIDALPDEALTIFEILKNEGYSTYFFNGGNPYIGTKFNFVQGVDFYVDPGGVPADQLTSAFLGRLQELKENPFFAYIHYMDLHLPYKDTKEKEISPAAGMPSSLISSGSPVEVKDVRRLTAEGKLDAAAKEWIKGLYDRQTRLLDAAVGRLLNALKQEGIGQDTLVILTADHGEEFWDHGNFEHGHSLYGELLHVPLLIAGPGCAAGIIQTPVSLVDLLPTILEKTGVEVLSLPSSTGGRGGNNLFQLRQGAIVAAGTLYETEKYGLISPSTRLKIIFDSGNRKGKESMFAALPRHGTGVVLQPAVNDAAAKLRFEIYDLRTDPLEQNNLVDRLPPGAAKLKEELEKIIRAGSMLVRKEASFDPRHDRELMEKLKSLGYLSP